MNDPIYHVDFKIYGIFNGPDRRPVTDSGIRLFSSLDKLNKWMYETAVLLGLHIGQAVDTGGPNGMKMYWCPQNHANSKDAGMQLFISTMVADEFDAM